MNCPYCLQKLTNSSTRNKAGQTVEFQECFQCGGHWFPRWLGNDITQESAQNLDSILAKLTVSPPKEPRCPVCQDRLSIIKHDSVAKGVVVWACPNAHGNFFPRGDLFKFKQAQEAKISYHQLWGVPIRTVFAVLLPVVAVLAIAGGVPLLLQELQQPQETRTRAGASYTSPIVTILDETSVLISFSTTAPTTSKLNLYQDDTFHSTRDINTTPETRHTIRLTDLSIESTYTYTLTLTNSEGISETTDRFFISLSDAGESEAPTLNAPGSETPPDL